MTVALVIPVFISCDDNKKDDNTDYAEMIVGVYNGDMNGKVGGQLDIQTIPDVDIDVIYASKNKATLIFNETISTIAGNIPLDVACPVTTSWGDGKVKITGSTTAVFENPVLIGTTSLPALPISVDGTIDSNGTVIINIKDTSTSGVLVTVTFNGIIVDTE